MDPVAASVEPEDSYPLSSLQHGMLLHHLARGPHTGIDIQQFEVRVRRRLDVQRLARAWALIATRHPVLRTRFRWDGLAPPFQEVMPAIDIDIVSRDLSAQSVSERTAAVARFLAEDRARGIDLRAAPLWRVTLFEQGEAGDRMVWTFSHALLDGCHASVVREVFDAYDVVGASALPRFERARHREHLAWRHQEWLSRADAARAFWRARLGGFVKPSTLDVVQGPSSAAGPSPGRETLRFAIRGSTSTALHRLCRAHGVHASSVVQAAWALVVSAFSGEDDVVFGEVRSCRRSSVPDAEPIVGMLANTVPVRAWVPGERLLLALLRELDEQRAMVGAFEHTPLVESAACADVPHGARLFDTIITIDERGDGARAPESGAREVATSTLHERTGFSLALTAVIEPALTCRLSFDRSRFEVAFARRVANLFKRVLHAMASQPEATLAALPRLPAADERILASFSPPAVAVPGPESVHACIEAQVDRTPDAVALVWRDESLTYGALEARASQVAADLISRGVGPQQTVGVFVGRSLETVVALLGILKSGAAYLPLDPSHPRERLAMILEDAQPGVVLTVSHMRAALPSATVPVVVLDSVWGEPTSGRVSVAVAPDDLAYVIYTSGSTGRPKGVQVEHRNVVNFFHGMDEVLGTTPGVWLAVAGISFDISVLELLWTLARGFRVVVQEPQRLIPPGRLDSVPAQIRRHGVTHLQLTPSHVAQLVLEQGGLQAFSSLRHLLVGGEALPAAVVDQLRPHLTGAFHNMYGPTETTVWSTTATVTPGQPITIGRPIANTTIHIRSLTLRPLPIGVAGELLIGGAGVTRGYLRRPDLTTRRFVQDPLTGERLYRTGDLAAWRADGALVFLGRLDHQVKIRGHRVELGEIDAVIGGHATVSECATVTQPTPSGDLRLVAYVVPRALDDLARGATTVELDDADRADGLTKALRQYAQTLLPAWMVPSAIVLLEAMPLTPTGKIDRRALAPPHAGPAATADQSLPMTACERAIAGVMQALTGRRIGVDENFFAVGAHSLLLLQASLQLGARLGRSIPVLDMSRHPTARTLAAALANADADRQTMRHGHERGERRRDAMRRQRDGRAALDRPGTGPSHPEN
jgi:amino acid adenylation domain-containing protein